MTYTERERTRAHAWKQSTTTLPEAARPPAAYVDKDGVQRGQPYDFCLPAAHAALSLLPEVREPAVALFAELGIPWHAGVAGGPGNHLLSSQVQCVNALGQMVADPDRIRRAFGELLGIDEVLQIEPGRFLSFEYIGPRDYFDEGQGALRIRGAHCTSVDAAFLHRTRDGVVELVLLEWKYTEWYSAVTAQAGKDAERWRRYGTAWTDPHSPIKTELVEFTDILQEPFYQLVRQQLLAHALEQDRAEGADRVRVVHVMPAGNDAYQQSMRSPTLRGLGDTVSKAWQQLLRTPDRFVPVDSALLLDTDITSREYVLRYADDVAHNLDELKQLMGADNAFDIADAVDSQEEFDGDVVVHENGIELTLGRRGTILDYPFAVSEIGKVVENMEREAEETPDDDWLEHLAAVAER